MAKLIRYLGIPTSLCDSGVFFPLLFPQFLGGKFDFLRAQRFILQLIPPHTYCPIL
jgi:hypothetical protein